MSIRKEFASSSKLLNVPLLLAASLFAGAAFAAPVSNPQSLAQKIASVSKASVGKKMWLGYGLPNGYLGCAAAVSNVLNKSGVKDARSATVTVMRRQILKSKYHPEEIVIRKPGQELDEDKLRRLGQPGDVLLAFKDVPEKLNGGGTAHCGIYGSDAQVYTNDWNDGIWKYDNVHRYFHWYPYVYLVRLREP